MVREAGRSSELRFAAPPEAGFPASGTLFVIHGVKTTTSWCHTHGCAGGWPHFSQAFSVRTSHPWMCGWLVRVRDMPKRVGVTPTDVRVIGRVNEILAPLLNHARGRTGGRAVYVRSAIVSCLAHGRTGGWQEELYEVADVESHPWTYGWLVQTTGSRKTFQVAPMDVRVVGSPT